MAKEKVYKVSDEISKNAHIDEKKYKEMYARSINDSDVFWEEQAEEFITWLRKLQEKQLNEQKATTNDLDKVVETSEKTNTYLQQLIIIESIKIGLIVTTKRVIWTFAINLFTEICKLLK